MSSFWTSISVVLNVSCDWWLSSNSFLLFVVSFVITCSLIQKNHGVLQVKFRLVVFRPFVGEVISAKLKESNAEGLRCKRRRMCTIYFHLISLCWSSCHIRCETYIAKYYNLHENYLALETISCLNHAKLECSGDELECLVAISGQVDVSRCTLSNLECLPASWGQIWQSVYTLCCFFMI